MLEITRQADYALRAVGELARLEEGERLTTAAIAERQNIPQPFLAKIISQLALSSIVEATRGAGGGVRLARETRSINMREVIEAIDGPITINRCVLHPETCDLAPVCAVCEVFVEAQESLVTRLETTTFADVTTRALALEQANGRL